MSLLSELEGRHINIEDMIESHDEFVSTYFGSSSIDGGCLRYAPEQVKVLFASVPDTFPYEFKGDKFKELDKAQNAVYGVISELKRHPAHMLNLDKIPRMISIGRYYAGGSLKQKVS